MSTTTFNHRSYQAHINQEENNAKCAFDGSEPVPEPAVDPNQDPLAAALREIDDLEALLTTAATNGVLLAEKYFALEHEHNTLDAKYTAARLRNDELERQRHFDQQRPTAVRRCIALEHQLNTQLREQEAKDDIVVRLETGIRHWRSMAESVERDNAWLRETVAALESEKAASTASSQHILQTNRVLKVERSELSAQVDHLSDRLKEQSEREQRLTLTHNINMQRLGATVLVLEDAEKHASHKCDESERTAKLSERTAKLHEEAAMNLRCVVRGLKQSLTSLEQDHQLVLDQRAMETSCSLDSMIPDEEVVLSGWDHFLLALASIKDCFVDMSRKIFCGF
jgi:chromosome segregation ATPase